jgi:hypothetical protein
MPACDFSIPEVFAGCGVLKPLKRPDLFASGFCRVGAKEGFSDASDVVSF